MVTKATFAKYSNMARRLSRQCCIFFKVSFVPQFQKEAPPNIEVCPESRGAMVKYLSNVAY